MRADYRIGLGEKGRLVGLVVVIIALGFGGASLFAYRAARTAIRASIERDALPVAAETVYARLQKDLVAPVFISSVMASDAFLHDWVARGEGDLSAIERYLAGIKERFGAITAFFVSERTKRYYYPEGVLKTVDRGDYRDVWYWRVRGMVEPYELNVDPDLANGDIMTVFINYRVLDAEGRYIGAAGVGQSVDAIAGLVERFRDEHGTAVYFSDRKGRLVAGRPAGAPEGLSDLGADPPLAPTAARALAYGGGSFAYRRGPERVLLNVSWIPELSWYLFVERPESPAVAGARRALAVNLGLCLLVVLLVVLAAATTVDRYQTRLEEAASRDPLTGALNRLSLPAIWAQALASARRSGAPLSAAMIDLDDFKKVNDERGHPAGDALLKAAVAALRGGLRGSDILCRWGGEEFLVILPSCPAESALEVAEKLRAAVEGLGQGATASIGVASASFAAEETAGARNPGRPEEARRPAPASMAASKIAEAAPPPPGGPELELLVARADAALFEAKRAGKNRVVAG